MVNVKDIVKLRKQGKFYAAFEEDALVLSEITGYRVVNGRLGFPVNSLGKVSGLLNDYKVNYLIIEKDKEIDKMIFPKNNYNKYLKLGKKSYDDKRRKLDIIDKIKSLNKEQLEKVINYIEELCDAE